MRSVKNDMGKQAVIYSGSLLSVAFVISAGSSLLEKFSANDFDFTNLFWADSRRKAAIF